PVREAKWIEGLTGRATLFSNAIRYSFRPDEWQRSLAADTLTGSSGALVNEFFFARFADPGSSKHDRQGLIIGANHGGEFVDLLSMAPSHAQLLAPGGNSPLATLSNMTPDDDTASLI